MSNDAPLRLSLHCPLMIDGEEGKATSGRRFTRENPADFREVASTAEQGTLEDTRAAIDAARPSSGPTDSAQPAVVKS